MIPAEADAGSSLNLRPAWSTKQASGQPDYPKRPCLEKKEKIKLKVSKINGKHKDWKKLDEDQKV